jgi:hypothetical protein
LPRQSAWLSLLLTKVNTDKLKLSKTFKPIPNESFVAYIIIIRICQTFSPEGEESPQMKPSWDNLSLLPHHKADVNNQNSDVISITYTGVRYH